MKDYNLTPQERANYCICSILQAIFRRHGIDVSQQEIAGGLTPSEKGFLNHDKSFREFLRAQGFEYHFYWHNETPFNEPDMVLADMHHNDGIIGINSHAYLLTHFRDSVLGMINPKDNCGDPPQGWDFFQDKLFDPYSGYCPIKGGQIRKYGRIVVSCT